MARGDARWIAPIRHQRPVVITAIIGFILLVCWGLAIRGNAAVSHQGQQLLIAINSANSPALDTVSRLVSMVFEPAGALVVIIVIVAITALACRRLGDALFTGFVIGVVYGSTYLVKLIVQRPRPSALPHIVPGLVVDPTLSFPSGHVAMISSVVVVLILIVRRREYRVTIAIVGLVTAVVVAYARLYAGAHFPEDVIASMLYALAVGPGLFAILYRIDARLGVVARVNSLRLRPQSR